MDNSHTKLKLFNESGCFLGDIDVNIGDLEFVLSNTRGICLEEGDTIKIEHIPEEERTDQ